MTVARSPALPEREQRRAEPLPAGVAEAGLGCILGGVDRLQRPERARLRARDGGEIRRLHATADPDARDREGTVARPPPANPAGAEGTVVQLREHALAVRRLPAARERRAPYRRAEPVFQDALRLAELVPEAGRVELVEEWMGERVAADLHAGGRHLPELRPDHVPGRPDQGRHHEEGRAQAELRERREHLLVVAGTAVVE